MCVYVCMKGTYVCVHLHEYLCLYMLHMYACVCSTLFWRRLMKTFVFTWGRLYLRMYVVYARVCVYVCVCTYVYVCLCLCICIMYEYICKYVWKWLSVLCVYLYVVYMNLCLCLYIPLSFSFMLDKQCKILFKTH